MASAFLEAAAAVVEQVELEDEDNGNPLPPPLPHDPQPQEPELPTRSASASTAASSQSAPRDFADKGYKLLQTLGEGEFGKVKLATHLPTGNKMAIKLFKRARLDDDEKRSKLAREVDILRSVVHKSIVRLIEMVETADYVGLTLEYASGGELFDYILAQRYLQEDEAARLFAQLIDGVHFLHIKNVVHRDLKLENLLLSSDRNLVIIDFGFANKFPDPPAASDGNELEKQQQKKDKRIPDSHYLMSTSCGSPCYAAPELVIADGYVGTAADVWSCGVILYAMLAGYLPFDDDPANPMGDNITLLYKYILSEPTPLNFPPHISTSAITLLKQILVPDPEKRATMHDVMEHPWLLPQRQVFEVNYDLPPPVPIKDKPSVSSIQASLSSRRAHTPSPPPTGAAAAAAASSTTPIDRPGTPNSARQVAPAAASEVVSASPPPSFKAPSPPPRLTKDTTSPAPPPPPKLISSPLQGSMPRQHHPPRSTTPTTAAAIVASATLDRQSPPSPEADKSSPPARDASLLPPPQNAEATARSASPAPSIAGSHTSAPISASARAVAPLPDSGSEHVVMPGGKKQSGGSRFSFPRGFSTLRSEISRSSDKDDKSTSSKTKKDMMDLVKGGWIKRKSTKSKSPPAKKPHHHHRDQHSEHSSPEPGHSSPEPEVAPAQQEPETPLRVPSPEPIVQQELPPSPPRSEDEEQSRSRRRKAKSKLFSSLSRSRDEEVVFTRTEMPEEEVYVPVPDIPLDEQQQQQQQYDAEAQSVLSKSQSRSRSRSRSRARSIRRSLIGGGDEVYERTDMPPVPPLPDIVAPPTSSYVTLYSDMHRREEKRQRSLADILLRRKHHEAQPPLPSKFFDDLTPPVYDGPTDTNVLTSRPPELVLFDIRKVLEGLGIIVTTHEADLVRGTDGHGEGRFRLHCRARMSKNGGLTLDRLNAELETLAFVASKPMLMLATDALGSRPGQFIPEDMLNQYQYTALGGRPVSLMPNSDVNGIGEPVSFYSGVSTTTGGIVLPKDYPTLYGQAAPALPPIPDEDAVASSSQRKDDAHGGRPKLSRAHTSGTAIQQHPGGSAYPTAAGPGSPTDVIPLQALRHTRSYEQLLFASSAAAGKAANKMYLADEKPLSVHYSSYYSHKPTMARVGPSDPTISSAAAAGTDALHAAIGARPAFNTRKPILRKIRSIAMGSSDLVFTVDLSSLRSIQGVYVVLFKRIKGNTVSYGKVKQIVLAKIDRDSTTTPQGSS